MHYNDDKLDNSKLLLTMLQKISDNIKDDLRIKSADNWKKLCDEIDNILLQNLEKNNVRKECFLSIEKTRAKKELKKTK